MLGNGCGVWCGGGRVSIGVVAYRVRRWYRRGLAFGQQSSHQTQVLPTNAKPLAHSPLTRFPFQICHHRGGKHTDREAFPQEIGNRHYPVLPLRFVRMRVCLGAFWL